MSDLYQVAESFPVWKAILWCFYPIAAIVLIELFLRSVNDNAAAESLFTVCVCVCVCVCVRERERERQ